jgi:hypothetical protein
MEDGPPYKKLKSGGCIDGGGVFSHTLDHPTTITVLTASCVLNYLDLTRLAVVSHSAKLALHHARIDLNHMLEFLPLQCVRSIIQRNKWTVVPLDDANVDRQQFLSPLDLQQFLSPTGRPQEHSTWRQLPTDDWHLQDHTAACPICYLQDHTAVIVISDDDDDDCLTGPSVCLFIYLAIYLVI